MSEQDDIRAILSEIRDNQIRSLKNQEAHLALAQEQLERAKKQVQESIGLQREAIAKQRAITRVALPAIALCIVAILYLVLRYF